LEFGGEHFTDLSRSVGRWWTENSAPRRWQVGEGGFRIGEHELREQVCPHGALRRRQVADRENRMQQRAVRSTVIGRVVPPVVHQDVERPQRFDVVPPSVGNEQRIAGIELRLRCVTQRLGVTREPPVIGA
jgi:hypothetical protein